jgi:hypothetical protein
MSGKSVLGVLVTMVGVAGLVLMTRPLLLADKVLADEQGGALKNEVKRDGKQRSISVDVVIEEVDLAANTVTARSTLYVIPPHDDVGGMVFMTGTSDSHKDQATKYVRLPVMPPAKLREKKPKVGQLAKLRLDLLEQDSTFTFVVVGIDEITGPERIGVNGLDAPVTNDEK